MAVAGIKRQDDSRSSRDKIAAIQADARWTDSRTPTAHAASHAPGGGDTLAVDAAAATGSLRTLGTSSTSACAGNDARLSNSRTPTSHTHPTSEVTGLDAALATIPASAGMSIYWGTDAAPGDDDVIAELITGDGLVAGDLYIYEQALSITIHRWSGEAFVAKGTIPWTQAAV